MKYIFSFLILLSIFSLVAMEDDETLASETQKLMAQVQACAEQSANLNHSKVIETLTTMLNSIHIKPENCVAIGRQIAPALIAPDSIKAKILLLLAQRARDQKDVRSLVKLAGTVADFGHFEVFLFEEVYEDVATQIRDELSVAIEEGNIKTLAQLLAQGKKIEQLHLIQALRLKNENMAKLLVYLGADVELPVLDNQLKLTPEAYARSLDCKKAAAVIQKAYLEKEMAHKS